MGRELEPLGDEQMLGLQPLLRSRILGGLDVFLTDLAEDIEESRRSDPKGVSPALLKLQLEAMKQLARMGGVDRWSEPPPPPPPEPEEDPEEIARQEAERQALIEAEARRLAELAIQAEFEAQVAAVAASRRRLLEFLGT